MRKAMVSTFMFMIVYSVYPSLKVVEKSPNRLVIQTDSLEVVSDPHNTYIFLKTSKKGKKELFSHHYFWGDKRIILNREKDELNWRWIDEKGNSFEFRLKENYPFLYTEGGWCNAWISYKREELQPRFALSGRKLIDAYSLKEKEFSSPLVLNKDEALLLLNPEDGTIIGRAFFKKVSLKFLQEKGIIKYIRGSCERGVYFYKNFSVDSWLYKPVNSTLCLPPTLEEGKYNLFLKKGKEWKWEKEVFHQKGKEERIKLSPASEVLITPVVEISWKKIHKSFIKDEGLKLKDEVLEEINLLTNSSFEEGEDLSPVDWVFLNQNEKTEGKWVEGVAHKGNKSLKIKGKTGLAYGRWISNFLLPLEPSQDYLIGGWYKGKGGWVNISGHKISYSQEGKISKSLFPSFGVNLRLEETQEWTFFSKPFHTPSFPLWVRIALGGGGKGNEVWFDDVFLIGTSFALIEPKVPIIREVGDSFLLEIWAGDASGKPFPNLKEWRIFPEKSLRLEKVEFFPQRGTYGLKILALSEFSGDLRIEAKRGKEKLVLLRKNFLRIVLPLHKTFSFAVYADPHINYITNSSRNEKFLKAVKTINTLDTLFVLALGDLRGISNGYTDFELKHMCDIYKRLVSQFKMPVYNIAGNHDVDKTFLGAGTRWYYRKYMGYPYHHSFDIGNFHFVGIDTNVPGIYGRDHQGGFVLQGQDEWLERDLKRAKDEGKYTILYFHEPIYEGGQFWPGKDRNRLLDLIYRFGVGLVLEGHNHHDWAVVKKNPYVPQVPSLPELNLGPKVDPEKLYPYYHHPSFTVFLQTTTVSSFLIRGSKYFGFRYIWVKDGKIKWCDTVPLSFEVEYVSLAPQKKKVRVKAGPEKSFSKFPLKVVMPPGKYQAYTQEGDNLPISQYEKENRVECWIEVDLAPGEEKIIFVEGKK